MFWSAPAHKNRLEALSSDAPKQENRLARLAREAAASPFMRGLTALPYRLAGAPVDLADMVVRPSANAAGIPIAEPENMYGTSDWMIKQAANNGLLMPRTDTGSEMAGDFLGQIAAPGVGPGEAAVAKAIFAGPLAIGADQIAMQRAASRLDAGDDPAKVWAEEGWFRGPDGQMRWEIDDSRSMFRGTGGADSAYAGSAIHHPELFEAYPNASQVFVQRVPGGEGSFSGEMSEYGRPRLEVGYGLGGETHGVVLHEMQHGIQGFEGFAAGGNPAEMAIAFDRARKDLSYANDLAMLAREAAEGHGGDLNAAYRAIVNAGIDLDESAVTDAIRLGERGILSRVESAQAALTSLGPAAKRAAYGDVGDALYRRLAGEAEARAVQARINLTPEQRRARYPLADYDVPLDELIIRR